MAEFQWQVDIIESESGWGQKLDSQKFFDDEKKALAFVVKYNKKNNLNHVPAWYMRANPPQKVLQVK